MQGYGRGARMKIERDRIEWLAGVRAGETLGSPGRHADPQPRLGQLGRRHGRRGRQPGELRRRRVTRPRPGHADLVGVLKYDRVDARDILERASARETTARVAAGALARRLLDEFGVEIGSHVVSLGGIRAARARRAARRRSTRPPTAPRSACSTPRVEAGDHRAGSTQAKKAGDTLGGEIEVVARGVVVGLGSHVSWDRKLDGRLAGMLMSIPAVKGVEIGLGFEAARRPGLRRCTIRSIADAERRRAAGGDRAAASAGRTNNAGGLEGGMTTGEPLVVRVAMKPISTLMSPLPTVDLATGAAGQRPERALRRDRGAGDGRHRRGAGGARAGRRDAGEVRRRLPRRDAPQLRRATSRRSGARWAALGRRRGLMPTPHRPRRAARRREEHRRHAWWPRRCGLPFVDIDAVIVRRMGMPVEQIFGEVGEARFRELEREAVADALAGAAVRDRAGRRLGGPAGQPRGRHGAAALHRLSKVPAGDGARAGAWQGDGRGRSWPAVRRRRADAALLQEREPYYAQADFTVDERA